MIECLKQACTGELPPNTRSGQSFIHDPKVPPWHAPVTCTMHLEISMNLVVNQKLTDDLPYLRTQHPCSCSGWSDGRRFDGCGNIVRRQVLNEREVKGQIRLRIRTAQQAPVVIIRSFQLTQKKAALQVLLSGETHPGAAPLHAERANGWHRGST